MNNSTEATPQDGSASETCMAAFQSLRQAWRTQSVPTYVQRMEDLKRLRKWILDNQDEIVTAISEDFNGRSSHETLMCEVLIANNSIKHTESHLKDWMRKKPKSVYWAFLPAPGEGRSTTSRGRRYYFALELSISTCRCTIDCCHRCRKSSTD